MKPGLLLGALFFGLLAACAPEGPGDGGGQACTQLAAASVVGSVVDQAQSPLAGASVTYTVEGGAPVAAEQIGAENEFVAGWETAGDFVLFAEKAGFQGAQESATVLMDEAGCHVVTEFVQLALLPAP